VLLKVDSVVESSGGGKNVVGGMISFCDCC
jgi:hypothetical protein